MTCDQEDDAASSLLLDQRAVADGDFTRRQPVVSKDELGILTESFNAMTAQLAEARVRNEESRQAIETTRAYLESILGSLSAGVLALALDPQRIRFVTHLDVTAAGVDVAVAAIRSAMSRPA